MIEIETEKERERRGGGRVWRKKEREREKRICSLNLFYIIFHFVQKDKLTLDYFVFQLYTTFPLFQNKHNRK